MKSLHLDVGGTVDREQNGPVELVRWIKDLNTREAVHQDYPLTLSTSLLPKGSLRTPGLDDLVSPSRPPLSPAHALLICTYHADTPRTSPELSKALRAKLGVA